MQNDQYNRKRIVQKRIDYNPVTITFHDDPYGVTTASWEAYYRYYYRDGNYTKSTTDGSIDPQLSSMLTIEEINFGAKQYRYGFDNDSFQLPTE